jgi:hypothetical protein
VPAGASGGVLCLSPFRALAKRASPGGTREQRRASTATQTLSGASHPCSSRTRMRIPPPSTTTSARAIVARAAARVDCVGSPDYRPRPRSRRRGSLVLSGVAHDVRFESHACSFASGHDAVQAFVCPPVRSTSAPTATSAPRIVISPDHNGPPRHVPLPQQRTARTRALLTPDRIPIANPMPRWGRFRSTAYDPTRTVGRRVSSSPPARSGSDRRLPLTSAKPFPRIGTASVIDRGATARVDGTAAGAGPSLVERDDNVLARARAARGRAYSSPS